MADRGRHQAILIPAARPSETCGAGCL